MDCSVSVIVLTYNSSFERLAFTLDSILCQKGINFEIVITDDGSTNNHFDEIKKYFNNHNFSNYTLIDHKKNRGTVLNYLDGVLASNGEYIKGISPGDALVGDSLLHEWCEALIKSKRNWSFGRIINYRRASENGIQIVSSFAHPQNIKVYENGKIDKCRWNYIVLDDIATGAAMLCQKDSILKFLQIIQNRIIYAEDNIFRLMMYKGEVAYYYPFNVVLYEFGDGVSTSGNQLWSERLKRDWDIANRIMINEITVNDTLQEKMKRYLINQSKSNRRCKNFLKYFDEGRMVHILRKKIFCRKTDFVEYDT